MKRTEQQRAKYERDKEEGLYSGSSKQVTWNHSRKRHECCESKKALYHKAACPNRGKRIERRDDPMPVDGKFKELVRELRAQGLTSGEAFEHLTEEGVETTLAKVNRVYA